MTVTAAAGATEILLGAHLVVRDAADAKRRLDEALARGLPIRLHAGRLERVDTAALQLLFAFLCEARTRGHRVEWHGDNGVLARAFECLGLPSGPGTP